MQEHTQSPSLRQHMLAVEAAMRAYAAKFGEDPETWGVVGLLHDFDYERYPNAAHSATEEHPSWGVRLLRERGLSEPQCRAILGHASYTGVPRDTPLAKSLFGVDELCGFLVRCAPVDPPRELHHPRRPHRPALRRRPDGAGGGQGARARPVRRARIDRHVPPLLAPPAPGGRRGARVSPAAVPAAPRGAETRSSQAARHLRAQGDDRRP